MARLKLILLFLITFNCAFSQWHWFGYVSNLYGDFKWVNWTKTNFTHGSYAYLYANGGLVDSETQGNGWEYNYFTDMNYFNDSIVVCYGRFDVFTKIKYTFNDFKTVGSWNVLLDRITSFHITPKFIYYTGSNWDTNDTLSFIKFSPTSNTVSVTRLPKYYSGPSSDKMAFLNDSIGHNLTRYRSNPSKYVLTRTVNFGNTWNETFVDSTNLLSFSFPSSNTGYISKSNGSVFKTIDGGSNWNQVRGPSTDTINIIKFANDTLGYVAGKNGFLSKTTDGGQTWVNEVSTTTTNIISLWTFGQTAYFFCGNGLYKNAPVGIKEQKSLFNELNIYPNPTNGNLNIDFTGNESGKTEVIITNLLGCEVYKLDDSSSDPNFSKNISIGNLSKGVYFLTVKNSGRAHTQKLIIAE